MDSCWLVGLTFKLKSLFWLIDKKIDILDDFTHRVRNIELEVESSYEHIESMVELV